MEARTDSELPFGRGWRYEPKWDGFRCLARRYGRKIELTAKSGKPLARYFPEIVEALQALEEDRFTLDGELLIKLGRHWSFEALQARLHLAESRIRRLAGETPASLMLFDALELGGKDIRGKPLSYRRDLLARFFTSASSPHLKLSPGTASGTVASRWLEMGQYEGVIAKRLDGLYLGGERAMVKVKRRRTADCVVGGFRYATDSKLVGSLLLGLYNDQGLLDHVGFTSGFGAFDRRKLTRMVEGLRGGPGFTGNAPGAPSRWSTERSEKWAPLKPKLVVEVSFDHVSDGRFRHGTKLLRLRPDKSPKQCRMEQIE